MNFQQGYRPPQPAAPPKRRTGKGIKALLTLVVLAVLAGAVYGGMQLWQQYQQQQALAAEIAPYNQTFVPGLYVDGISLGGLTAQQGIDAVVNQITTRESGWNLQLTYQNHLFYTLHYEDLDVSTDIGSVYALLEGLYKKGKLGTLEERKAEIDALAAEPYHAFTTRSDMTDERLDSILSQIQQQLTSDPVDAYLAYFMPDYNDPFIIQEEVYGATVDIAAIKQQILEMAAEGKSGVLEIQTTPVPPAVTKADVRSQVTLRSKGITPVSSASTEDRTSNIRTAFSRLSGTVLAPGEKLSFNKVTLDRTIKNGYKYAIEYELGREKMGIGGGVCQASTTLYLAALKSNLKIVKRTSHSDPVAYTTFGQDATVVYGSLDLIIQNTTDSTLYITAKVNEVKKNKYECEVCIYGPSLGDGVSYELRTETVEILPVTDADKYEKDTAHDYVTYKDEAPYLVRKARDGFINETYLQKWQNGDLISESFVSRDECKARGNLYLTGTLDRTD
ncbi:MAG: VanW family protein [Clostridia bacterium]|nr:VanW family protein [Clostridia bacterium]